MILSYRTLLLPLSLLAAVLASPQISWNPCNETEFPSAIPNDCGTLEVPLDYTDPESKPLALELLRVPALVRPSNGSILFNFGGPGEAARGTLSGYGPIFQQLTGGQYDLVAFDPRGTGNTLLFSCYTNELDILTYMLERNPANVSDTTLGRVWARGDVNANACLQNANETISLLSSTFVARDLISVVDALGEDELLRYWGTSYGTTLGATVASMFPGRIDKMVLDGVQNPHEYYNGVADIEKWTDSDKVFSGLFTTCIDAGERCPLNTLNQTAEELEQSVWDLIDDIKYYPISFGDFIFGYSELKGAIAQAFYAISAWPILAEQLTVLLNGTAEDHPELFNTGGAASQVATSTTIQSLAGIHCVDRKVRASFDEFSAAMEELYDTSRSYGDLTSALTADCAQWKVDPREPYEGNLHNIEVESPVLIIGNTWDSQTSIVSARNISASFPDSEVLQVHGYGHGSISIPSVCTVKEVSTYWTTGKLPESGRVCKDTARPYMNETWAGVLEELGAR
ncbi:Alpha/Beta hydrolase protein [Aspergillus keveii]|uniref:Alpha/Beta hydrolase protein n=1 Tax=Aspergillus keveii TaxID=714993 RepID=A0ABR4G8T9_9EURO